MPMTKEDHDTYIIGVILTQYSLNNNKGLKEFGERGEEAVVKELSSLKVMNTFPPIDTETINNKQKVRAISSLMLLKEKRDGTIKRKSCAIGTPQCAYTKKEDAASPTCTTESVFITSGIDAHERRHVATIDVLTAFLHAENVKDIVMRLERRLAELMVEVDPSLYRKCITTGSKGKPILYIKMHNALYGIMRSVLLFYRIFVGDLEAYGSKINPYHPCVANMEVGGSQMTVVWYVDGLKVSHRNTFEITKLAGYLDDIYPVLKVNSDKIYDYLGMNLDFSEDGNVKVSMIIYLNEILRDFPELLGDITMSPAANHLFKVRSDDEA